MNGMFKSIFIKQNIIFVIKIKLKIPKTKYIFLEKTIILKLNIYQKEKKLKHKEIIIF